MPEIVPLPGGRTEDHAAQATLFSAAPDAGAAASSLLTAAQDVLALAAALRVLTRVAAEG